MMVCYLSVFNIVSMRRVTGIVIKTNVYAMMSMQGLGIMVNAIIVRIILFHEY